MTDSPAHPGHPHDVDQHPVDDQHGVDPHPVDQHGESVGRPDGSVEQTDDPGLAPSVHAADPGRAARPAADLAAIERDLDGVETALRRLDDGSYWTDEVTGDPISDEVLAADPVTRRTG